MLNEDTHDIDITSSTMHLTPTVDETCKQRVIVRLLTYRNEWFLDRKVGVPYYESILGKNRSKETIDSILKRTILQTEGVISLDYYRSKFEYTGREYYLYFWMTVEGGKEPIPVELTI